MIAVAKVDAWVGVGLPSYDGALLPKLRLQNVSTDVTNWGKALFYCKGRLCYRAGIACDF